MRTILYKLVICFGLPLLYTTPALCQEYKLFTIRNCQQELRTVTFQGQVRFFWKWAVGMSDISRQTILLYSARYKVDTAFLRQQIEKMRQTLPKNFLSVHLAEDWYNNVPDTPGIWFTEALAQIDKQGHITIFSAYRVTFEGDNAQITEQRIDPKITNIEFIFDKATLAKLAAQLKTLPLSM